MLPFRYHKTRKIESIPFMSTETSISYQNIASHSKPSPDYTKFVYKTNTHSLFHRSELNKKKSRCHLNGWQCRSPHSTTQTRSIEDQSESTPPLFRRFGYMFCTISPLHRNLPKFRNFGWANLPSACSQYGDTNAMNININVTTDSPRATRRFLLWKNDILLW